MRRPPNKSTDASDGGMLTVPCPACESTASTLLFSARDTLHGKRGTFGVSVCSSCGFTFTNPRPPADELLRFYPEEYAPHHLKPVGAFGHGPGLRRWIGRVFHWYMTPHDVCDVVYEKGDRLLELGCSTGVYLDSQRAKGIDAYGVEFAREPAEFARTVLGLTVFEGELEDARFQDAFFDGVAAWMFLEHVPQPRRTVREVRRIIKTGGRFALSVPNAGSWEFKFFGKAWFALQLPTHQSHFTVDTLHQLLLAEGFFVEQVLYQRNIDNIVSSVGIWLEDRGRFPRVAKTLKAFPSSSSPFSRFFVRPLIQPLAYVLSLLRQSGRMTIVARAVS